MFEKQFHQGSKLQKLVENSKMKLVDVCKKSSVPKSSLYDMYKKDELQRSKIMPVLDVLGVSYSQFMGNYSTTDDASKMLLMEQEIEYLKKQLSDKEEIIELLKGQKKVSKTKVH